jgi:hypothetical protein
VRSDGRRPRAWVGLLVLAALGACSKPKSYIALTLEAAGTAQIPDVT